MKKLAVETLVRSDLRITWNAYSNPDDITQ